MSCLLVRIRLEQPVVVADRQDFASAKLNKIPTIESDDLYDVFELTAQ